MSLTFQKNFSKKWKEFGKFFLLLSIIIDIKENTHKKQGNHAQKNFLVLLVLLIFELGDIHTNGT